MTPTVPVAFLPVAPFESPVYDALGAVVDVVTLTERPVRAAGPVYDPREAGREALPDLPDARESLPLCC